MSFYQVLPDIIFINQKLLPIGQEFLVICSDYFTTIFKFIRYCLKALGEGLRLEIKLTNLYQKSISQQYLQVC